MAERAERRVPSGKAGDGQWMRNRSTVLFPADHIPPNGTNEKEDPRGLPGTEAQAKFKRMKGEYFHD
jgi:hypothetical protein